MEWTAFLMNLSEFPTSDILLISNLHLLHTLHFYTFANLQHKPHKRCYVHPWSKKTFLWKKENYVYNYLSYFFCKLLYNIYACIRRNECAKGAKGAMLKSTVHTFAFLCKMTMPRNFFSVFFNAPLTDWYLICYLLNNLTVCRSITSARQSITSAR